MTLKQFSKEDKYCISIVIQHPSTILYRFYSRDLLHIIRLYVALTSECNPWYNDNVFPYFALHIL